MYAAGLTYIASQCAIKVSLVLFIRNLTPFRLHEVIASILNAFILVWGVTSEIAAAFQCSIPGTWNFAGIGAECFNIVGSLVLCVYVSVLTYTRLRFGLLLPSLTSSVMLRLFFGQYIYSVDFTLA